MRYALPEAPQLYRTNPYAPYAGFSQNQVQAAPSLQVPPGPNRTWVCPIQPSHRFTGKQEAFDRYVAHFEDIFGATDDSGNKVGPHQPIVTSVEAPRDFPIQVDPLGIQFVEIDVRAAFAKAIGAQPPFMQVQRLALSFRWRLTGPFMGNYVLLITGLGDNKIQSPDNIWYFQASGSTGSKSGDETLSNNILAPTNRDPQLNVNVVELSQPLQMVRIQPYPLTQDGRPNTEDKLDLVGLAMRGYI